MINRLRRRPRQSNMALDIALSAQESADRCLLESAGLPIPPDAGPIRLRNRRARLQDPNLLRDTACTISASITLCNRCGLPFVITLYGADQKRVSLWLVCCGNGEGGASKPQPVHSVDPR